MIKCLICKKSFKNDVEFMTHLVDKGLFPKRDHAIPEKINRKIIKDWQGKTPCFFCGGHVTHSGHGLPDGGATWEISCDKCGYLYDED